MAKSNSTRRQAKPSPSPHPKHELDSALGELLRAITLTKTVAVAPQGSIDQDERDVSMTIALEKLSAAFNRMDLAIVHNSNEYLRTQRRGRPS
jgi:hypothetical protein